MGTRAAAEAMLASALRRDLELPHDHPLRAPSVAELNRLTREVEALLALTMRGVRPRSRTRGVGSRTRPAARRVAASRAGPSDDPGEPEPGDEAGRHDDLKAVAS